MDPSGSPIEGVCVKAALVSNPAWLADSTGQVATRAMTHTGPDGMWRLNLTPYTAYESQLAACAYYRITEGTNPPTVTNIRVPEGGPGDELWMRDLVFDPDPCSNRAGFVAVNTLARLHDVDASSLALAKPGDFLVLLPNGKWGAGRAPMPLTVSWSPDADDLLTINLLVRGFGGAGAKVGFGDGTQEQTVYGYDAITHTYSQPGTYIVTATDVAWPAFTGSVTVGIKDHMPRAHVFHDGEDDWRVLLWVDESSDDTEYVIDWGDDTPVDETPGHNMDPQRPRVAHQYAAAGTYQVTITDLATQRQSTQDVWIGGIGAQVTYDTPARPRTDWFWMAPGAAWEFQPEGAAATTGVVSASARVSRPATSDLIPGDYGFTIREVVSGQVRRTSTRRLKVPTQTDWRMDVETSWRVPEDLPSYQTVTVAAHGARSRCTVEWGDGSASELVDPGVNISHVYHLPAPQQGWRLRLTETNVQDPRVWSRVLGEPRHIGVPVMSARTRGAVDLEVEGIASDYNDDWYTVTWDEGGTPDPVAATGRWYPASHVYTTEGAKTIVLDGPGMAEPVTRDVNVAFYPGPSIGAAEEVDGLGEAVDPTRMTARISVDNSASGGPCTVHLGDNSPPRPTLDVESFVHQFQVPGTYYIVVSSDRDPTARGIVGVTVPFGIPRTLYYDLTATSGGYEVTCTITGQDAERSVQVRWESGGPWNAVPPGGQLSHVYPQLEEMYAVTVAYIDGSEQWTTTIETPWPSGVGGG